MGVEGVCDEDEIEKENEAIKPKAYKRVGRNDLHTGGDGRSGRYG